MLRAFIFRSLITSSIWLFILSVSSFWFIQPALAQKNPNLDLKFKHFSREHGLSQATVLDIQQDNEGYIWIATQDGLNRFDGYSFKIFKNNLEDSTSLSGNFVTKLYKDPNGLFWIGTQTRGLNLYDATTESFTRYAHDPNDLNSLSNNDITALLIYNGSLWIGTHRGLNKYDIQKKTFHQYFSNNSDEPSISNNRITCLLQDKNKNLWIGTGSGLNKMLANGKFEVYLHESDNPTSISNDEISCIYEDELGNIFVGTQNGLNILNPQTKKFTRLLHNPNDPLSISDRYVNTIFKDDHENLWIGTQNGLNLLNPKTLKFRRFYHKDSDVNSLNHSEIRSIFQDKNGLLCIGTSGGINFLDYQTTEFIHLRNDENNNHSLSNNNIWGILEDSKHRIWVATSNGLNMSKPGSYFFTSFFNNPNSINSISTNNTISVYEDRKNRIWIATADGLNYYDEKNNIFKRFVHNPEDSSSLNGNRPLVIFQDRLNNLWIGLREGGLELFDEKTGTFKHFINDPTNLKSISHNRVNHILEDSEGRLWIATQGGINLMDRQTGTFTRYQHNPKNINSLSNNITLHILEDSKKRLWISTYGGGFNLFNPKNNSFIRFTENNGLSNNNVYGILEDSKNNLWMSTNNGINKFNPETKKFTIYYEEDGLQGNEFDQLSYMKDHNGYLYFGGKNGISVFHPDSITKSTFIPPVVITDFQLFNQSVNIGNGSILKKAPQYTETITLTHDTNIFAFKFSALSFSQSEKNQYAYKLEPLTDWIYTNSIERKASFIGIPPGDYIFRVKASNDDGVWNEKGTSIKINILPPWWLTWWAKSIWYGLVISVLIIFYRTRTKVLRNQKERLQKIVDKRTIELQKSLTNLIDKQNEIETLNEELNAVNEELTTLNESLELNVKERTSELEKQNLQLTEYAFINSHLLRAPLARILGLSKLISIDPEKTDPYLLNELIKSSEELDTIIRKISEILYDSKNLSREDVQEIINRNFKK